MDTMEQGEESHHPRRTYILTKDLGPKVNLLGQVGIKTPPPDDPLFGDIQQELARLITSYFPNDEVRVVTTKDLAGEILAEAKSRISGFDKSNIISTCTDITAAGNGVAIEVNRIIDTAGTIIGLGPRPGYPSVQSQVHQLNAVFYNKKLVLVEDGTFTGGTLKRVLELLNHRVQTVVVGIGFPSAIKAIKENYLGEVAVIEHIEDPLDWMPDHDFFPFVPNCGRIVGSHSGMGDNEGVPSLAVGRGLMEGASFCMPYLRPFLNAETMSKWTNVPLEHDLPLSRFCLEAAVEIYRVLEKLNHQELYIGELMRVRPRVAMPIHQGGSPNLIVDSYRILTTLQSFRKALG